MGVAVVDGKVHAIAGRMDSYDFNTSLNAVYEPKTDAWTFRARRCRRHAAAVSRRFISTARSWCSAAKRQDGCSAPTKLTIRKTDTWEALTPMPIPRHGLHGATAAVIGNMVHVPGGGPLPGGSVQGAYTTPLHFPDAFLHKRRQQNTICRKAGVPCPPARRR